MHKPHIRPFLFFSQKAVKNIAAIAAISLLQLFAFKSLFISAQSKLKQPRSTCFSTNTQTPAMKLPLAFLVMMGAIKADGIRPPPSAAADADDSPILSSSSRPTSTGATTAADEDDAHLKTRQTEGYADLVASTTTTPGLIGGHGIGECVFTPSSSFHGNDGRQVAPGPKLAVSAKAILFRAPACQKRKPGFRARKKMTKARE